MPLARARGALDCRTPSAPTLAERAQCVPHPVPLTRRHATARGARHAPGATARRSHARTPERARATRGRRTHRAASRQRGRPDHRLGGSRVPACSWPPRSSACAEASAAARRGRTGSAAVARAAAAGRRVTAPRPARAPRGRVDGAMSYYVTTPIYYVNGEPHLGHAYTTIAADVLARHMRQRGEDVFFLTGTDEHGEPVAQAAEKLGITPRELGDQNAVRVQGARGAAERHERLLHPHHRPGAHGEGRRGRAARSTTTATSTPGTYEGWYCPRCADFKTEAELEDGNRCPIHKIELEIEKEDNWFFRLSTFQEPLERLYAERPGLRHARGTATTRRSRSSRAACSDVSLSRARLKWGVPVPWDESQVIYVWIDALLNYYTALTLRARGRGPDRAVLAGRRPPDRQGHPQVPRRDLAGDADGGRHRGAASSSSSTATCCCGEHKMSKSLGNVIDPFQVIERLRRRRAALLLLREVSFGADGEVSPEGFETRYNDRARQRVRQPREPHAGDDRALPRRRGARAPSRRPSWRPSSTGSPRRVARRLDERRAHRRRSTRSGSRSSGSTATSRTRSPGSSPRTRPRPARSTRCSTRSPRACAWCPCCSTRSCPARRERLLAALGREELVARRRARSARSAGGAKVGELGQLFPRVEAEAPAA